MEWSNKEEMEMEMLLQEISYNNCHGYYDGSSSSSSRSISPSGDDTSVTTLSSPDSFQRFSSSDGVALRNTVGALWVSDEPEHCFEKDLFEYSVFEARYGGDLEKTEFGMSEYYAFPPEINSTLPWINNDKFDVTISNTDISHFTPVFDDASFDPYCNANLYEQFPRENNDVPVAVSYQWQHTDVVECINMDTRSYYLNPEKLRGFRNKKQNESLIGVEGYVYLFAKDHNGCRFLQKKLEEGRDFINLIFDGILSHVIELASDLFGNYLMQKMVQLCNEDQRRKIVVSLTQDPSEIIGVSLNVHGTRTVQKLVETVNTKEEIGLLVSAFQTGFLDVVNDPNGNHVVQRCLQYFDVDDNKVIFDAAIEHCEEISTHQHGCCVMQKCIARSSDKHREKLVNAICANAVDLAQDSFGNYVVQYLLKHKHSSALTKLAYQFEGRYAHLSRQKFSSNVVEKCLRVFDDSEKAKIVYELLSVPRFKLMLQHPYSNYVIQAALQCSQGSLHAALVSAIKPHAGALRTNTYCKKIFRRSALKS